MTPVVQKTRLDIVFLLRSLRGGGAERQIALLAKGLAQRGHRIHVVTFYDEGGHRANLAESGVIEHVVGKQGRWDIVAFLLRLRHIIIAFRPTIIYAVLPVPNILAALLRFLTPHFVLVWGMRASNMVMSHYDWTSRLTYRLEQLLRKMPNLVVANSETGKAVAIARGFVADRIVVVDNGIDTETFKPGNAALRAAARARFSIPPDSEVVGVIARHDPMKDYESFLLGFACAVQARGNLVALIAGPSKSEFEALMARAARVGIAENLRWGGSSPDIMPVYSAMDLLCLPSAYGEGFPNVIGEAMACGVPCVATDVGDAGRIIGDLGIVVPIRNYQDLSRGIIQMLDRLAEGKVCSTVLHNRIAENFSARRMITESENVLMALQSRASS